MNSYFPRGQFVMTRISEFLPELEDMRCEIKKEPEDCVEFPDREQHNANVKDHILAEAQFTSTMKTESEMLETSDFLHNVLKDEEMKQENTEVNGTDPITEDTEWLTESTLLAVSEFYKAFISSEENESTSNFTNDAVSQLNQAICNLKIEAGVKSKLDKCNVKKNKYSCKLCNKSFNWISDFDRHLVVHSGKKPFKCNLCGKSYIQNTSLYHHMKSHRDEKYRRFVRELTSKNQF